MALRALRSPVRGVAEDRRRIETLWLLRRRNRRYIESSRNHPRQILRSRDGVAQRALLAKHNRLGAYEGRFIVRRGDRHSFLHETQDGSSVRVRRLCSDPAIELQRMAVPARAVEVHRSHASRLRRTSFTHVGDVMATRAVEGHLRAIRTTKIFL